MKIGDLVKILDGPLTSGYTGHGIIVDLRNGPKYSEALVHWFDEWSDEKPREWNKIEHLFLLSGVQNESG
tara:strand:+ start:423 stop:632 length:210 start_codon:yes stop_codon:yes gene_type:complete